MSRVFDSWATLPITPPGRSLIEASAGTGKTWTIAALYLRLLLEDVGVTPRQIVVATFTNAAAAELRERLRRRIQRAERAAHGELLADLDDVDTWLTRRWVGNPEGAVRRDEDLRRLRIALAELDLAPIGTLHGLCARILREHPFAAGGRFEPAELVDGDAFARELATDLARTLSQTDVATRDADWPPAELATLGSNLPGPRALAAWLKPGLRIEPGLLPDVPSEAAADLRAGAREGLFRAKSVLPRIWLEVAEALAAGRPEQIDEAQIEVLRMPRGTPGLLKGKEQDEGLLRAIATSASIADALAAQQAHHQLSLLSRLRRWGLERKHAWMQRHDSLGFDDLLAVVHDVLIAEAEHCGARPLADALFAAWPVALIDEFQDTDGLQYGILDTVYRAQGGELRGRLLMIGDPKQAIYRFRGGDIHTYARAARDTDDALTLTVNQRSSTPYVEAINAFFRATGEALDANTSSGIVYQEVTAADRADQHPYAIDGVRVEQPLVIHTRPTDAGGDKGKQVDDALAACANQIATMLASGTHMIGNKPLKPEHIAVLLPDNYQIARLRSLLERRGVPCVTRGRDSVFAGDIARDLQVLMHGVLHAESMAKIRAALLTRLGGMRLAELAQLDADPIAAQRISLRFHAWRQHWRRRGVPALIDALIAERGPVLLADEDGERVLTDLRHLGELLQAQAEAGMGQGELLAWFAAQRDGSGSGADSEEDRESRQLRIESQSPRVRLMTLHASKGLEFPLVFLPLMSMHEGRAEKGPVALHDEESGGHQLHVDDAARERDAREAQDERFRVLYVALTRAVHACHVYAVPAAEAGSKGRRRTSGAMRSPLDVLLERMDDAGEDTAARIEWREGWPPPVFVRYQAEQADTVDRIARAMPPSPNVPLPSRHSFSSLSRGHHAGDAAAEAAADDEAVSGVDPVAEATDPVITAMPEAEHPILLALAKPRGTGIGNALHDALEQRRIGVPMASQTPLIAAMLRRRNLLPEGEAGTRLCDAWAARLDEAFATPLDDDLPPLAMLTGEAQRAEMEFHFALAPTTLRALREACATHGEPNLVPDSERRLAGLMTGKIDLLFQHAGRFHVLDYKGNFAGTRLSDYGADELARVMESNQYRFQALLYVIALDRHLRLRMPGYDRARHLGDVSYLFLRAFGLAPGIGLWRHRFDDGLIDAVDRALPAHTKEGAA